MFKSAPNQRQLLFSLEVVQELFATKLVDACMMQSALFVTWLRITMSSVVEVLLNWLVQSQLQLRLTRLKELNNMLSVPLLTHLKKFL